jgi:hypothetical protein
MQVSKVYVIKIYVLIMSWFIFIKFDNKMYVLILVYSLNTHTKTRQTSTFNKS